MDLSGTAPPLGSLDSDNRRPSMTDEEMFAVLSKLPDFDRFPLPGYWYSKFNIPKPTIPTFQEALNLHYKTQNAPGDGVPIKVMPLAPGGVRPLIEVAPVEVITQRADEGSQENEVTEEPCESSSLEHNLVNHPPVVEASPS
jgi:hypothetical protein